MGKCCSVSPNSKCVSHYWKKYERLCDTDRIMFLFPMFGLGETNEVSWRKHSWQWDCALMKWSNMTHFGYNAERFFFKKKKNWAGAVTEQSPCMYWKFKKKKKTIDNVCTQELNLRQLLFICCFVLLLPWKCFLTYFKKNWYFICSWPVMLEVVERFISHILYADSWVGVIKKSRKDKDLSPFFHSWHLQDDGIVLTT